MAASPALLWLSDTSLAAPAVPQQQQFGWLSMQLLGLGALCDEHREAWERPGGARVLLLSAGLRVCFAHDAAAPDTATIRLEVDHMGAAAALEQWLLALREGGATDRDAPALAGITSAEFPTRSVAL